MEEAPEARDSRGTRTRDRPRDREHRPERQRDRDHRPERQRDRDHRPERQRDRDHGPERQRDRDRRRDRDGDRQRDRDPDRRGNRDRDRRGHRDADRWSERDPQLDRQDREHPRSNGQRLREKSRQSRTPDVFWEQPRDRAPPPWPAQRTTGFGPWESDDPSGRSPPFSPSPGLEEVEYYESEAAGLLECHKCRYLCTGRACCQLMMVLLNLLILACSSVSYNSTGGYTGITSLGGIYYYQYGGAFSGFNGPDGEKAQQLDIQFYHLKLPTVTAAMAYGGGLMAFSCLLILLGVLRVPWHCPPWLVIEAILDVLIAVSYIPALYFYFHHLSAAYNSTVCKERETLYQSKGCGTDSGSDTEWDGSHVHCGLLLCPGWFQCQLWEQLLLSL
ncbi:MARVEL domain-containing protein 3 isoform X3 [Notamacropus eugenii]|uniref:MARVEL domain-containing protein 3 isoform X3 n=1 Tax=Notamacropus eugenii TaxID=9315 RepID=UPI003B674D2D